MLVPLTLQSTASLKDGFKNDYGGVGGLEMENISCADTPCSYGHFFNTFFIASIARLIRLRFSSSHSFIQILNSQYARTNPLHRCCALGDRPRH